MANKVTKAVAPTGGRLAIKIGLSILVALGIIDDTTAAGIINDPVVLAMVIGLVNMLRHEAEYRRRRAVSGSSHAPRRDTTYR